jgi:hypothetical protein
MVILPCIFVYTNICEKSSVFGAKGIRVPFCNPSRVRAIGTATLHIVFPCHFPQSPIGFGKGEIFPNRNLKLDLVINMNSCIVLSTGLLYPFEVMKRLFKQILLIVSGLTLLWELITVDYNSIEGSVTNPKYLISKKKYRCVLDLYLH